MGNGGKAPASHCGGLGLVPGQSVRDVCRRNRITADFPTSISVFYYQYLGTPPIFRTRCHPYSYTLQKDEQTKPGVLPTKIMLISHIGEHD
jgi:hypothetical protein